jgi:hypothetical protein
VTLHHQDLLASDMTERDGYRITTPLRTLLDAASSLSAEHLAVAAQDAIDEGLVRKRLPEEALKDSPKTSRRASLVSDCRDLLPRWRLPARPG